MPSLIAWQDDMSAQAETHPQPGGSSSEESVWPLDTRRTLEAAMPETDTSVIGTYSAACMVNRARASTMASGHAAAERIRRPPICRSPAPTSLTRGQYEQAARMVHCLVRGSPHIRPRYASRWPGSGVCACRTPLADLRQGGVATDLGGAHARCRLRHRVDLHVEHPGVGPEGAGEPTEWGSARPGAAESRSPGSARAA